MDSIHSIFFCQIQRKSGLSLFALYCFVSLSLIALPALLLFYGSGRIFPDVWSFHIPWHLLNYQSFGFVKRGFLGTLLLFFHPISDLKLFSLAVYIFLSVIFVAAVSYYLSSRKVPIFVSIPFLLSPCTFLHFGFDAPRSSEILWLILFVISLLIAESPRSWLFRTLLTSLLCCFQILVFEGSLFFAVPVVALRLVYPSSIQISLQGLSRSLVFLAPIAMTLACVHVFGKYEFGYQQLASELLAIAPSADPAILSEVLIGELAFKNMALSYGLKYTWYCNSLLLLCLMSFWLLPLIRSIYRFSGFGWCSLYCVSCGFGVVLFIVALDYARYCSLIFFISSLLAFSLIGREKLLLLPRSVYSAFSFAMLLGPVGSAAVNPFPLLKYLFGSNLYPFF